MGKQTQSKEKKQHMASPTDDSKPTSDGYSKKKKKKKKKTQNQNQNPT